MSPKQPWLEWLGWLEHHPRLSIPGRDTHPGCEFDPWSLGVYEKATNQDLKSLALSFPPSSLSKSSEKMSLGED